MAVPLLFSPLTLRGVTFPNRVVMSPMCQYVAERGLASDWHLVHLGSRAVGGAGAIMVEASAVSPDARISLGDLGLWADEHIEPLARIAGFVHSQGAVPGLQLAHAGRKGSCRPSWAGGAPLTAAQGGWRVVAPSALAFDDASPLPHELNMVEIEAIATSFMAAAKRAVRAGFELIEIHAAHGYLLHEFLSPLANRRSDEFGGSFANRTRMLRQVAAGVRAAMPERLPLFVRLSATDWHDGGWDLAQSIELAGALGNLGVDLIDVSSGGLVPSAPIPLAEGYQVPMAKQLRAQAGIATAAVGLITRATHADQVLRDQAADLVFVGRQLLRDPYWTMHAQRTLGAAARWPAPYRAAWRA